MQKRSQTHAQTRMCIDDISNYDGYMLQTCSSMHVDKEVQTKSQGSSGKLQGCGAREQIRAREAERREHRRGASAAMGASETTCRGQGSCS